jgi:hypothetical protein
MVYLHDFLSSGRLIPSTVPPPYAPQSAAPTRLPGRADRVWNAGSQHAAPEPRAGDRPGLRDHYRLVNS